MYDSAVGVAVLFEENETGNVQSRIDGDKQKTHITVMCIQARMRSRTMFCKAVAHRLHKVMLRITLPVNCQQQNLLLRIFVIIARENFM
jgi:hypothetical protein